MVEVTSIAELPLEGGHPALDFVNTVDDRVSDGPEDYLREPQDLVIWGVRAGVLGSVLLPPRVDELTRALALREHLTAIFSAHVEGLPPSQRDLEALGGAVAGAHRVGTLVHGDDGRVSWRWDPRRAETVLHVVATAALDLLAGPAGARVGICAGPGCGWFFLDTSKRANRRWCSMGDCGQLAKNERRRTAAR